MSSKKVERPGLAFVTPVGTFVYPRLHEPDTKWKAEGEYSVRLRMPGDAEGFLVTNGKVTERLTLEEIVGRLEKIRDDFFKEKKRELTTIAQGPDKRKAKRAAEALKKLSVRDTIFAEYEDEDGEPTGEVVFRARMIASGVSKKTGKPWKRTPAVFDAKKKLLKPVPPIFGGTEGKLAVFAAPYYAANDNVVGITFYLEGVQILNLVKGGERDAGSMGFGEEEGYVADEESDDTPFDTDDTDDDDDDDGDADF